MSAICRTVTIGGTPYAVIAEDGNGPSPLTGSNEVRLMPMSYTPSDAHPVQTGWYKVRTARMEASASIAAVVAHKGSKYLGRCISTSTFTKFSRTGRYVNLNGVTTDYLGEKKDASAGGWALVHFTA